MIVRSTWDYTYDATPSLTGPTRWARSSTNRPEVLRWNSDKRYVADLTAAGLPVVPTQFVGPGDPLPELAGEVVVKPTISAAARDTGRYSSSAHADALALMARLRDAGRTAMVQPYLSAVEAHGEIAIVFFARELSHVLRKGTVLAPDEEAPIREGGIAAAEVMWDPDWSWRARRTMTSASWAGRWSRIWPSASAPPPLYARVDMLPGPDGAPVLLELEAVEPCLYLATSPGAVGRLATAVRA